LHAGALFCLKFCFAGLFEQIQCFVNLGENAFDLNPLVWTGIGLQAFEQLLLLQQELFSRCHLDLPVLLAPRGAFIIAKQCRTISAFQLTRAARNRSGLISAHPNRLRVPLAHAGTVPGCVCECRASKAQDVIASRREGKFAKPSIPEQHGGCVDDERFGSGIEWQDSNARSRMNRVLTFAA
jgi:hypothetical protein